MENNTIPESYAVLKVEFTTKSSTYERDGSAREYGRSICVRGEDIEPIVKSIKSTCNELSLPVPRVYIAGFVLANMGNLTSNEAIITILNDIAKSIKNNVKYVEKEKIR